MRLRRQRSPQAQAVQFPREDDFEREIYSARSFLARLLSLAPLLFFAGLPLAFALFDEDRLHMSDDYAAVSASIIVAILLLGYVEMHFFTGQARALIDERIREQQGEETRRYKWVSAHTMSLEEKIALRFQATMAWLFTVIVLTGALSLVALWTAIDGHGPARWVAWIAWLSIQWGVAFLLAVAIGRAIQELENVRNEYRYWWTRGRQ